MAANYLREVTGEPEGPLCERCGAIMVKRIDIEGGFREVYWLCESCGAHTGCT